MTNETSDDANTPPYSITFTKGWAFVPRVRGSGGRPGGRPGGGRERGVLCFSELFFLKEPSDATILRRDPVVLDCHAQGEHPIHIRWLKNKSPLVQSDHVHVLSNGSLFISEAENRRGEKSDEGSYQCLAQNKYGAILSQKAHLTIASISTFTQQPSSIVVMEGSVARFTCKISGVPPPIISWEFNRNTLPLATDRITVLPSGVLQIQGAYQRDAGNYRCVAANIASRRRSVEATLTVTPAPSPRIPQRPHIIARPQNLTVVAHGIALLECVAVGNPRPLISWSRVDHRPIDVYNTRVLGNGNLLISDVKRHHAGMYVCRATTPGTRNFTLAAANITVLEPPSLVEWPESLTRPRAGTGRFVCQAEGVPTPRISWLKNGEPVQSNGRIKMYNSKLVINQIIPEDDGIYQCQAENDQGSVLSTARLIVVMSEDRPSAPRSILADTVSSSAILLAWESPAYNADKVIAYSIHYMKAEGLNNEEYQVVIGNDTTRYIIDDLEPAQNYTFYIVAYMPMGASRMSDHVVQHTLEDVPLRAPELSLTSRSPTDILVSWQPLVLKLSRGRVSAYRLWYRAGSDGAGTELELPGDESQHLLEGLVPDTVYLLRIAASTGAGWGEPGAWTSHRTPKTSSREVPLAPELQLEPLNCTTLAVRWRLTAGASVNGLQGFRLFYHEESQAESSPVQLSPHSTQHIIGGLDPRKKYHVKLLAFTFVGEGYQADSTISTPGCVSVRDRLVPPPPPPHHVSARANSSSSVYLHWARPAFTGAQTINYTVRCNPVGLQNASLVLYFHTGDQNLLVKDLESNTRYEFAVRLHVDQLSSPWSPVVYQSTPPDAPVLPPAAVRVTLIERDTALVSWKPPDEPNVAVTRYTILYASRRAWLAGEWQIQQKEGSTNMALLENLEAGNVYLVKVSASNQMGDGPFSAAVELTVSTDGRNSVPTFRSHGSAHATGKNFCFFSPAPFSYLDQHLMTGIVVGVCIALTCIIICTCILVCRERAKKSCTSKVVRPGQSPAPPTSGQLGNENRAESVAVGMPVMREHFVDAKGGTDLIINSNGPVRPTAERKKAQKWSLFRREEKVKQVLASSSGYQMGTTLLRYSIDAPGSLQPPSSLHDLLGSPGCDVEGSHSSEGSHETGDSGRYSHDEQDLANLSLGPEGSPDRVSIELEDMSSPSSAQ
ncbi:protogenin A [Trichomycterus rosablanca]|uniref:protogenin A n=1 Tax=Trichomycterus rosablanca TaxID=2290929 RepID=UPI002F3609D9